jgi:hypothetical protein
VDLLSSLGPARSASGFPLPLKIGLRASVPTLIFLLGSSVEAGAARFLFYGCLDFVCRSGTRSSHRFVFIFLLCITPQSAYHFDCVHQVFNEMSVS